MVATACLATIAIEVYTIDKERIGWIGTSSIRGMDRFSIYHSFFIASDI